MLIYFCRPTQRIYDLDDLEQLKILRKDLMSVGFFDLNDNKKYYPLFENKVTTAQFIEILNNVKLFDYARTPLEYKKDMIV